MAKVFELCGMIHSQYENEARFADKIGWPRQRLNKITNGQKEPTLQEVADIAEGLNKPLETVANIFLQRSHQTDDI